MPPAAGEPTPGFGAAENGESKFKHAIGKELFVEMIMFVGLRELCTLIPSPYLIPASVHTYIYSYSFIIFFQLVIEA